MKSISHHFKKPNLKTKLFAAVAGESLNHPKPGSLNAMEGPKPGLLAFRQAANGPRRLQPRASPAKMGSLRMGFRLASPKTQFKRGPKFMFFPQKKKKPKSYMSFMWFLWHPVGWFGWHPVG